MQQKEYTEKFDYIKSYIITNGAKNRIPVITTDSSTIVYSITDLEYDSMILNCSVRLITDTKKLAFRYMVIINGNIISNLVENDSIKMLQSVYDAFNTQQIAKELFEF